MRSSILLFQENTDLISAAFTAAIIGSITNAGPFDAAITFPLGLSVAWNGAQLGQLAFPSVSLVADVGARLNFNSAFSVADVGHLTDFTTYLLTEPSFVWQIYATNLTIAALGIVIPDISISKNVRKFGSRPPEFLLILLRRSYSLDSTDYVVVSSSTTLISPPTILREESLCDWRLPSRIRLQLVSLSRPSASRTRSVLPTSVPLRLQAPSISCLARLSRYH